MAKKVDGDLTREETYYLKYGTVQVCHLHDDGNMVGYKITGQWDYRKDEFVALLPSVGYRNAHFGGTDSPYDAKRVAKFVKAVCTTYNVVRI